MYFPYISFVLRTLRRMLFLFYTSRYQTGNNFRLLDIQTIAKFRNRFLPDALTKQIHGRLLTIRLSMLPLLDIARPCASCVSPFATTNAKVA
jgi:hypothetical protein